MKYKGLHIDFVQTHFNCHKVAQCNNDFNGTKKCDLYGTIYCDFMALNGRHLQKR